MATEESAPETGNESASKSGNDDATLVAVKDLIQDSLNVERSRISPDASFIDDLGADSLDIVELVMAIEKHFDIEIPDEDAERISCVQDAVDYINDRQNR